jgi:hypothetical protein
MRLLDLYSGRWGWSKAFAARGWECVGIDLVEPPEIPQGCNFLKMDVFDITPEWIAEHHFDFICASSPCEQFSVHGMKHFHPNPPYPELGIKLFNHTRMLCESSGVPYIMENVRAAQAFVGTATHHCGPFYLWGTGVPTILPGGITKGMTTAGCDMTKLSAEERRQERKRYPHGHITGWRRDKPGTPSFLETAKAATIPPELSNCVANYAERILEDK